MASSPTTITILIFPFFFFFFFFFCISSSQQQQQQLFPSQANTLLRLPRLLDYPPELPAAFSSSYSPHHLCSIPPTPTLSLTCTGGRVTAITIISNRTSPLSATFSGDSLFTTLSRFPALTSLTLVSLGLRGNLSSKLHRFHSLTYLNISHNFFNGEVPNLTPLISLQVLDFSYNLLGPNLPDLNASDMTVLVLRNNSMRGNIPPGLASLNKLEKLDLSVNKLAGPIPANIFSLPEIHYVDLSYNKFTGALPESLSCGGELQFVSLSSNMLVGNLPSCISSNSSSLTVLDSGNCLSSSDESYQHRNSYCNEGALAAILPPLGKQSDGGSSKSKIGLILGIVGGIVGGGVILGAILLFVVRRVGADDGERQSVQKLVAGKDATKISPRTPVDSMRMEAIGLMPYRIFAMEELEEATNYFDQSNLVEEGTHGQFYKGWLRNGSAMIIRCLRLKHKYNSKSLARYMDVISKLRHRHLVSVIGHCIVNSQDNSNNNDMIYLVFECISNGTLRSHLTEWRKIEMLKWPQRVAAAVGVARGIQFLHTATVPGIVKNDLKIENILLDETLQAKISNYNLPMLPMSKNNKAGCESPFSGMDDSDLGCIQSIEHGEKHDVYQLGLILLEIITGKPPESQTELDYLKLQMQKALNQTPTKLGVMTDPAIRNTFAYDSLRTVVEVTLNCLTKDHRERPSIDDVLWNLQYSIQIQDGWANSENLNTQL